MMSPTLIANTVSHNADIRKYNRMVEQRVNSRKQLKPAVSKNKK